MGGGDVESASHSDWWRWSRESVAQRTPPAATTDSGFVDRRASRCRFLASQSWRRRGSLCTIAGGGAARQRSWLGRFHAVTPESLSNDFRKSGYRFASVLHPAAIIAAEVELAEGVQIMAGAIHSGWSSIGRERASSTPVPVWITIAGSSHMRMLRRVPFVRQCACRIRQHDRSRRQRHSRCQIGSEALSEPGP